LGTPLGFKIVELVKILKRISMILSALLLLLIGGAFVILKFYEDDVVRYALEKAKANFTTRVEYGNARLAFWHSFPNASLHLQDVFIEETLEPQDTLLYASSVFLEFNLLDLFAARYDIHAVDVEDAKVNLRVDKLGNDNWHFWKSDGTDTSQFTLALREVSIESTRFRFDHVANRFYLDVYSDESKGKGNFTERRFDVELDLNGFLYQFATQGERYGVSKKLEIQTVLNADTENGDYRFENADLELEKMAFLLSGGLHMGDELLYDIKLKGEDLDIDDLMSSLTDAQRRKLKKYNLAGEMDVDLTASRKDKSKPDFLEMRVVLRDGAMEHVESGFALEHVGCDLSFSQTGKNNQIKIREFKSELGKGYITAAGSITSLSEPELELTVTADMNLQDLKGFFALDTLERMEGHLSSSAVIRGRLNYSESDSVFDWKSLLASGSAQIEQGVIKLKNSNREFSALNAQIDFDKKNLEIRSFSGNVNGNDFNISGKLQNFIPFISASDERLYLNAKMESQLLDFTNMVETSATTTTSNNYEFELPDRIDFDLNTSVKKFMFRKFVATDVKGVTSLKNGVLTIDPVSFNTAEGSFSAQLALTPYSRGNYSLNCLAKLNGINIKSLFSEFENFNQEFIQDRHLKGTANATVQFRSVLSNQLELSTDKIESLIDVSIVNGELNGLESLQDLAEYIRGNKLVAPFVNEDKLAERMKLISFSKLENVIEIHDRVITIPLMDIRSSAMDITAKGTHTFDDKIDYAVGFNLRDVLIRKESEWSEADDGLGKRLYVSMKGTTDNPEFAMDKELAKEVRQADLQQEKQNVKALLKEELGLFKRDSNTRKYEEPEPQKGTTVTVQWDDEVQPEQIQNKEQTTSKQENVKPPPPDDGKKKKVPKWMQEKE
jgi:uncharacterized protein involved in outer membrane biogenesis